MSKVEIELAPLMILVRKVPMNSVSDVLVVTAIGVDMFLAVNANIDESVYTLGYCEAYKCAGYIHVRSHREHLAQVYFVQNGFVDKTDQMYNKAITVTEVRL